GTIEDDKDETIEAFEDLKAEGVIRSYGLSSIRPNVINYYIGNSNIDTLMHQFNPIDNRRLELMDALEEVVVIARGPLMQELFTEKFAEVFPKKFTCDLFNYSSEKLNTILVELKAASEELTALSYRYILDSAKIIVSADSTQAQLANNIGSYRKSRRMNF